MIFRKTGPHFSGSCSWTGVSPVPVFHLYAPNESTPERAAFGIAGPGTPSSAASSAACRGRHAAFLLPHSASKTRVNALMGEKDRMRGLGTPSFCSEVRTPSPQPSPLWGEGGVPCAGIRGLSWQTPPFSRRVSASEFFGVRARMDLALAKIRSHQLRNRSGPGKGQGWGLPFGRPLRGFVARIERGEIRERRFGSVAAPGFRCAQPGLRRNN
jgi:hypothetical protein